MFARMIHTLNRRNLLKSAMLLPVAAANFIEPAAASADPTRQPIKRVGGSNLKISINAFSFTGIMPQTHEDQTIGASIPLPTTQKSGGKARGSGGGASGRKGTHREHGQMTLFDFIDFCSKNNIDGCDPTGYFFPTYPTPPEDAYIFSLKRHAFELGVGISGTGVRNNFTTSDVSLRNYSVQ